MTRLQILLDMDGVLADFVSASIKAHGRDDSHDDIRSWNYFADQWGMTAKEFWSKCSGFTFWREIEPYPWAKQLYDALAEIGDVTISTSPSMDRNCIPAKLDWLEYHLGVKSSDVMCGGKKWLMSTSGNVLVDDSLDNLDKFAGKQGVSVLFRQPWNSKAPIDREYENTRVCGAIRLISESYTCSA